MTKGVQILRIKTYPVTLKDGEDHRTSKDSTSNTHTSEQQPVYYGGDLIRGKVVVAMLDNISQSERILEIQLNGRARAHWQESTASGTASGTEKRRHHGNKHEVHQHFSGETIIQSNSIQCVLWRSNDQQVLEELQQEDLEYEQQQAAKKAASSSSPHSPKKSAEGPSLMTKSIPFEFRLKADAPGSVHLLMEEGIHIEYSVTATVLEDETTVHQLMEDEKDFSITSASDIDHSENAHADDVNSLSTMSLPLTVQFHLPQPRGNHLLLPVRAQTTTNKTSDKKASQRSKKPSTEPSTSTNRSNKKTHNGRSRSHKKHNRNTKNSEETTRGGQVKKDKPILQVVKENHSDKTKKKDREPTLVTHKEIAQSPFLSPQLLLQSLSLQLHKRAFSPGEEVSLKGSFALNHHKQESMWVWVGVRMHLMLSGKKQQALDRILEEDGEDALCVIVEETTLEEHRVKNELTDPLVVHPPPKQTVHQYDFILTTQKLEPQELMQLDSVRLPSTILPSLSGLALGSHPCVKWTYELFLQAGEELPSSLSTKSDQSNPHSFGPLVALERRYTSQGNLTDDPFPEDHHHKNLFLHVPIMICGDSSKGIHSPSSVSTYPPTLLEETNTSSRGIGLSPQNISPSELDNPWSVFQAAIHAKQVTPAPWAKVPSSIAGKPETSSSLSVLSPSKRLLTISSTSKRRSAFHRRWRKDKKDIPHPRDTSSKPRFSWLSKITPHWHGPQKT